MSGHRKEVGHWGMAHRIEDGASGRNLAHAILLIECFQEVCEDWFVGGYADGAEDPLVMIIHIERG